MILFCLNYLKTILPTSVSLKNKQTKNQKVLLAPQDPSQTPPFYKEPFFPAPQALTLSYTCTLCILVTFAEIFLP